jgi:outer membrane lipoprotein
MRIALGITVLTWFLYGCAPSVLHTDSLLSPLTPSEAAAGVATGDRVRWGGVIAATNPRESETCFDVISKPLDPRFRPDDTDETMGRFRACAARFYDPGIYESGRLITIIGALRGTVPAQVGERQLDYPLVAADVVYLWKQEDERIYQPYPSFWFGYPFSYWGVRHRSYHRRH